MCLLTCGHIQHMYSWWWVGLSPETRRVKHLRRINRNCCILLELFYYKSMMHGTTNIKCIFFYSAVMSFWYVILHTGILFCHQTSCHLLITPYLIPHPLHVFISSCDRFSCMWFTFNCVLPESPCATAKYALAIKLCLHQLFSTSHNFLLHFC